MLIVKIKKALNVKWWRRECSSLWNHAPISLFFNLHEIEELTVFVIVERMIGSQ